MNTLILYLITSLIWSSTWLCIHFQVDSVVPPIWSVSYRFLIASFILAIYCIIRKKSLRLSFNQHTVVFIQGLLLFCLNFIFFYYGSLYLISGYVCVASACIIIMNIINAKLLLKQKISSSVLLGSLIGIMGTVIVFSSELKRAGVYTESRNLLFLGIILCVIANYFSSLGQTLSYYNQKKGIPILASNTIGMFYGAIIAMFIAISTGHKPEFQISPVYILTLLHLSILGSIVGFGCYLSLLGKIGADKAGYIFIVLPVLSLILSSLFENLQWNNFIFIGLFFILIGNVLVLAVPSLHWKQLQLNRIRLFSEEKFSTKDQNQFEKI